VVERTLAWLNRNRRLAKDFEATAESAMTWLFMIAFWKPLEQQAPQPQNIAPSRLES
jgi:hypothetical protein